MILFTLRGSADPTLGYKGEAEEGGRRTERRKEGRNEGRKGEGHSVAHWVACLVAQSVICPESDRATN